MDKNSRRVECIYYMLYKYEFGRRDGPISMLKLEKEFPNSEARL